VADAFFELGIPRDAVPPGRLRQIRVISITSMAVCAVGVPSIVQFFRLGMPVNAWSTLVAIVLALANLGLMRMTLDARLAGHVGVALFASIIVIDATATGGYFAPNFAWIYLIPLAAAILVDLRGLAVWTGITTALCLGFWAAPELGVEVVNQIPADLVRGNALFTRLLAIATLAVMSASFVVAQRRAEREQRAAREEMIRESRYVELLMTAAVTANQASSFQSALEQSVAQICEAMGWAGGHVCHVRADGSTRSSGYVHTVDPALYQPLVDMTFTPPPTPHEPIAKQAAATGRPTFVEDFDPDDPRPRRALAYALGLRAAIAVPILVGDEVRSVIEFVSTAPLAETGHLSEVFSHVGVQLGRVAERTAMEERLRHSQKMEAVGQLAAGLAHEINNPMSYVRSNLNALLGQWQEVDAKLDPVADADAARDQLRDCAELIEESIEGVERTIEIVRDIRDYSHTREGGDDTFEEADLSVLVDGALRIARADAPAGVDFACALAPGATTPCIPGQIKQVFVNLIVNAIHAVGTSGRIELTLSEDETDVRVRVSDDGPGIPEGVRARLFDPFFTTKGVGEGTGLGLSVSYEIVRRHGGSIEVQSSEGRGATFEVRLPRSL
jgi:signal transduction histidine kinase